MKNAFVDINIFIDVLEKRENWAKSQRVIEKVRRKEIDGFISAHTILVLWARTKSIDTVDEITRGFEIIHLTQEKLIREMLTPL